MNSFSLTYKVKSDDVSELMTEHFFKERAGSIQVGRESDAALTDIGTAQGLR